MEGLLQEIDGVFGIRGSFLCNPDGEVLASTLSGQADPSMITAVARLFNRTFEGLRLARRRKVQEMDLVFEKGRLVVKNLPEGCLVIECEPNINVPLLNMTANVVVRKISQRLKSPGQPAPRGPAAPVPSAVGVGEATIEKMRSVLRRSLGEEGVEFFDREVKAAGLSAETSPEVFERLVHELENPIGMAVGGRSARRMVEDMVKAIRGGGD
ncbi:MAG: roadblock/LC7 domain-containing protein [Chloroflexota bacterium]